MGTSKPLPKLKFYIERQVGNYYLRDGREGNFNFFSTIKRRRHAAELPRECEY
jgi:hypothetical protein